MPVFNVRLTLNPVIGAADCMLLGRVQVSHSAVRGNAIVFRQLETTGWAFRCAADRGPVPVTVPVTELMFRLMTYSQENGHTETCVSVANREEADTIPGFMAATVLRAHNFTITVADAPSFTEEQRAGIQSAVARGAERYSRRMTEELEQLFIDEVSRSLPEPDKSPPKPRTAPNCLRLMRRAVDII